MPSPSTSLATLRPDLAGGFMQFDLAMDRQGFIGNLVLPVFETAVQAGPFGKITLESLLQNRETKRAPGGGYNRGNWEFTTDSFACVENGAEEPIDDREAKMYASYFDVEQVSAQRAYDAVLRAQELRAANLIFNTTTWTGAALTTAVGTAWTAANAATAVPITNVNAAAVKVWEGCGMWPNALIMNRQVFKNLKVNDQVKAAIASLGAGSSIRARDITREMLAAVFDVDYVFVAGSAQNAAIEGQTRSLAHLWSSSYCMVARVCTSQDIREPGLGRTLHWGADGSQVGGTVETYRDENVRSDIVRVRHDVQEKVLYAECGHLLSGCV